MIKGYIREVEVDKIIVIERQRKDYGDIEVLANSIQEKGLLHPLVVMDLNNGTYQLLAGGRRLAAIKTLSWARVNANVYPNLTQFDLRTIEFAENVRRKDITFQERADAIKQLHDLQVTEYGQRERSGASGHSFADTAKMLNLSKATIVEDYKLASLMADVPSLADSENRSVAMKRVKQAMATIERDVAVAEYEGQEGAEDVEKRKLIDSYIVGDFFDEIIKVEDNTFKIVDLDWPYGIDLVAKKATDGHTGINDYVDIDKEAYPTFVRKVVTECYRVLQKDSWVICWYAPEYHSLIEAELTRVNFSVCPIPAIWTSDNYISGQTLAPKYRLGSSYCQFFYARKGNAEIKRLGRSNQFAYAHVADKTHPAEHPIELMEEILSTFAIVNSPLLVPFLGSGNTLLAGNNLKMPGIGFDLSSDYKQSYKKKVYEGEVGRFSSH